MSRSAEESASQFRVFYESVSWPPERKDDVLSNFISVLHDEEWYRLYTCEDVVVGSYNPRKLSSMLSPVESKSDKAKQKCVDLANTLWESVLLESTSAEAFYTQLSGAIEYQINHPEVQYDEAY